MGCFWCSTRINKWKDSKEIAWLNLKNLSNEKIKLLAEKVVGFILTGDNKSAIQTLKPLLDAKCPFSKLDFLGKEIGQSGIGEPENFFKAFDEIIDYNAMGGFVVVGQALIPSLENDLEESDEKIFRERWVDGVMQIKGIGKSLAIQIEEFLKESNKWLTDGQSKKVKWES